jgi:P2 family phage contractile tail tube protein
MSTLLIVEAMNLFCGDDDPSKSKHLTIQEVKLPTLQENMQDHTPGGSLVQIEIGLGVNKLEPTFKLAGFDPDLLVQFGIGSQVRRKYTARGVIRDKRTGREIGLKAIMEGRLGRVESDTFTRGDLLANEYSINEVYHYELFYDDQEKLYWDLFTNEWRVDSTSQYSVTNALLGIGSGA